MKSHYSPDDSFSNKRVSSSSSDDGLWPSSISRVCVKEDENIPEKPTTFPDDRTARSL